MGDAGLAGDRRTATAIRQYVIAYWVLIPRFRERARTVDHGGDVAEKLGAQTLDPMYMTPEQFAARMKAGYDTYCKLMRLAGVKIG